MALEHFKHSQTGRRLAAVLTSDDAIRRMEAKSVRDRPAVEAIGQDVQARVGSLGDQERKLVGRWIKEILADRGWRPDRKGRVASGHFFSRGMIYRRAAEPRAATDGSARLAEAQALLKQMPGRPMNSEQLVAERRRAFGHDE